jgi:hypothetical protein
MPDDIIIDLTDTDVDVTTSDIVVDVVSGGGSGSVEKLRDLLDVNASNLASSGKFVLTYDASTDKFVFTNPDAVIDSSVGIATDDPAPVGMSSATIDYLDRELDNKIDLDAGTW